MKVRIRAGASVCQDFGVKRWPMVPDDLETLFEVDHFKTSPGILTLRAYGYGSREPGLGAYGNGALFVNEADIVKDEDRFNLIKRFELLAARVRGLKSVLSDSEAPKLEAWAAKVDRMSDDLDDLALDVIRYVKGGPA